MKKNLPLVFGGIIVLLILVVMIFPHLFTSVNPYGTETIKFRDASGNFALSSPPFPPGEYGLLGTDQMGRDVFSFIIYGTRLTILLGLLVVIGRYLLALPIGLAAGFGSVVCRVIINQFNVTFSALPALIISVIVLKMGFFMNLDRQASIVAFICVLTLVGWARLGLIISERVQEILARPFIKGEIAIGKSSLRIALENVVPHLAPELVILVFMELAAALTIIMQLGIFEVFVGNLHFIKDSQGGVYTYIPVSFEPEWSSMLAVARTYIQSAPWLVISPAVAFFISILGFNMLGEGLRHRLQQPDSQLVVKLRKLLSPRLIFKRPSLKMSVLPKTLIVVAIVFAFLLVKSSVFASNTFSIDSAGEQFSLPQFEKVQIGTEEAKQVAEGIAASFKQLGFEPLDSRGFIEEYPVQGLFAVSAARLELSGSQKAQVFTHGQNFVVTSFNNADLEGGVFDAREEDLYALDYSQLKGKFVLVDSQLYPSSVATDLAEKIMNDSQALGVIFVNAAGEEFPTEIGNRQYKGVILWVNPQTAEQLVATKGSVLKVSTRCTQLGNQGRNIIGVLKGRDSKMQKESILIGLSYNYQDIRTGGVQQIMFGLELAKQLQQANPGRNIIFAFWDGNPFTEFSGAAYWAKHPILSPNKVPLYLDLSELTLNRSDSIYIRTDQAPLSRYYAFSIGQQLEQAINAAHIPLINYNSKLGPEAASSTVDQVVPAETGIATVVVKTGTPILRETGGVSLDQFGRVLLETLRKNSY